jgi:hypothetical protein
MSHFNSVGKPLSIVAGLAARKHNAKENRERAVSYLFSLYFTLIKSYFSMKIN